ncbi:aminotransferase class IV [Spirilliplanes yamanashiensis]|nr:aminotransferase class IV [Spirilliplanes yamanashiensis]MDP9814444.1 4-amino-4-deoxychorismate lyase [Spirilliplanes yamanashiensis]
MTDRIVVVPGRGALPPGTPLVAGDDPAVLHGDGVFETVHVRSGVPWLLGEHLTRLARSADLLALDPPDLRDLAAQACALAPAPESALRLVVTRSAHWATISAVPPATLAERRAGVRVVTASLGVAAHGRPPWSLSAAKSLSYAANLAARRWAATQGADDVLWTSIEGYALEAPTANVVWLAEGELRTTPADTGILPGVTAAHLLAVAGLPAGERLATVPELAAADGIWLTSSLRGLAEVRALDGTARPASPWTARLLGALGFPA